jgi:hypothetical protein
MPTRSKKSGTSGTKKTGKSPAARKIARYEGRKNSSALEFGIDPPIIIDGGGLGSIISSPGTTDGAYVILRSAVELESIAGDKDYPYAYRIDVDIKWMDWHGLGHKKDKSKNGKVFKLELHQTDEPQ